MTRREQKIKATVIAILTAIFMSAGTALGIACGSALAYNSPEHPEYLTGFLLDKPVVDIEQARNQDVLDNLIVSRIVPVAIDGEGTLTVTRNGSTHVRNTQTFLRIDDVREQVRFNLVYTGSETLDAIEVGDIPGSIRHGDTVAVNQASKVTFISVRFASHGDVTPDPSPARPTSSDKVNTTPAYTPTYTPVTTAPEPMPVVESTPAPVYTPAAPAGYAWAIESDYQAYAGRPLPAVDKSLDSVCEYVYTGLINGYMDYDLWIDGKVSMNDIWNRIIELHSGPGGKGRDLRSNIYSTRSQSSFYPDGTTHLKASFMYADGTNPAAFDNELYNVVKGLNLGGLSDYDRSIGVYNWIANRLSYAYYAQGGAITPSTAYYSGVANCMGYSTLFQAMCEKVGIEVQTVTGNHFPGTNGHMWTIALIDGQWRGYDTCWADAVNGTDYLCVGYSAAMDSQHIPD